MKKLKIHLLLLAATLGFFAQAQTPNPPKTKIHLTLKTRNYGDRVALRWAFSEPAAWRYLNKQGYILERFELDDKTNKAVSADFKTLTPAPIRPWTEAEWNTRISPADTFAVVAAGCLLRQSELPADANFLKQMELREKDETNRFGFALFSADMSPLAAEGLGLRFDDRDVKPDRKYAYRLRVADDPTDRFQTDTAIYMVATNQILAPQPPDAPETLPGDSLLTLRWRKSPNFTAYHVERSADGGSTWQRLTKQPFLNGKSPNPEEEKYVIFPDREVLNYKPYRYRILGITPFGELSEASQFAENQAIDLTPTATPILSKAENKVGRTVELAWKMPAGLKDLKGFIVSKSESVEGPWMPLSEQMLPPETRSLTDPDANEFGRNFYRVFSVDDHGNTAGSNPAFVVMNNTAPPAPPKWKTCTVDTNGVVTLRWQLGSEADIWGYQIYYSNQRDHELVPLTGNVLEDTVFTYKIPLDNLTEEIFYSLRAVDVNYNVSEHSEKMRLTKPDKVPPVAPVFHDFAVRDTGVLLVWATSTSRDVAKHILLRREKSQENWQTLAELGPKDGRFFDDDVQQKTEYEYVVYAIDDAGLASPKSFPVRVRALPKVLRQPIEDLRCSPNAERNAARLSWSYSEKPDKVRFKIYRVAPDGGLKMLGEVPGEKTAFEDKAVRRDENVRYAVRAFHFEGGASPVARTGEVRI